MMRHIAFYIQEYHQIYIIKPLILLQLFYHSSYKIVT